MNKFDECQTRKFTPSAEGGLDRNGTDNIFLVMMPIPELLKPLLENWTRPGGCLRSAVKA